MRKGTKIAIITGAVFGIAGTACVITGLLLGASWKDVGSAVRSSLDLRHTSLGQGVSAEVMELVEDSHHEEEYSEYSGIDYYGGIRSVELDSGLCDVYVYGASAEGENTVGVERIDGKVYVEKSGDTLEIQTQNGFGQSGSVSLYLPAKGLENLEIDAGSGSMVMLTDEITAKEADLQVAGGTLEISGMFTAEKADLEVGLGSMSIAYLDAKEIAIDCGMGNFTATVAGQEQDYYFQGECGLGNLEFGSNVYSGISDVKTGSQDSTRKLEASCGAGNLEIYTEQ